MQYIYMNKTYMHRLFDAYMGGKLQLKVAFLDVDGTLTDDSWRRYYLDKHNYTKYQQKCMGDELKNNVINDIQENSYDFLFITSGRNFQYANDLYNILPEPMRLKIMGMYMRQPIVDKYISSLTIKMNAQVMAIRYLRQEFLCRLLEIYAANILELDDPKSRHNKFAILVDVWDDDERAKYLNINEKGELSKDMANISSTGLVSIKFNQFYLVK